MIVRLATSVHVAPTGATRRCRPAGGFLGVLAVLPALVPGQPFLFSPILDELLGNDPNRLLAD